MPCRSGRMKVTVAFTAAVVAAPLAAGAAVASTRLGQSGPGASSNSCSGSPDFEMMQGTRADGTSYRAPSDGVLTSWTFQSHTEPTTLTLRVFRLVSDSTYSVVADGGPLQTVPAHTARNVPVRIPVRIGDKIGVRSTTGACALIGGNSGDTILARGGAATPVGGSNSFISSGTFGTLMIAAEFEKDVDGDGFGDESQDACPASALTQSACPPPDTTISKVKAGKTTKVKFSASLPGASFSCSLDGKKAKACVSPQRYRCLKPGKHRFTVTATSPFGIVDPTPAAKKLTAREFAGC